MKKKQVKKAQKAKAPEKKAKAKDSNETKKAEVKKADPVGPSKPLTFQVGALVQDVGQPLTIELPEQIKPASTLNIRVHYTTNDQATAFSWLTPQQTLGKKLPYLFTQCQFLACRSVAPLQDTPAIKATYSAEVTVPKDFNVKMSANDTGSVENGALKTYKFYNQIKTPSYLIALAIGDL